MIESVLHRTALEPLCPVLAIGRCVYRSKLGLDLLAVSFGVDATDGQKEAIGREEFAVVARQMKREWISFFMVSLYWSVNRMVPNWP